MYKSTNEIAQTKSGSLEIADHDYETLCHGNELRYFFNPSTASSKKLLVNLLVNRIVQVLVTQETLFRGGIVTLFLTHISKSHRSQLKSPGSFIERAKSKGSPVRFYVR